MRRPVPGRVHEGVRVLGLDTGEPERAWRGRHRPLVDEEADYNKSWNLD